MSIENDQTKLDAAEQEFERTLGQLSAAQPSVDAQSIWAISIARRYARIVWFWRATSGALAACLLVAMWARPPAHESPRERIVYVHDQQPISAQPPAAPTALAFFPDTGRQNLWAESDNENYLDVRQDVMRRGLRALTPIRLPLDSNSTRPLTHADPPPAIDRAIQPSTDGPVQQFFDLLNKGSQL
jgi:hypothetical protein